MIDTKHIIASIVEEKKKNNKEPAIAHFTEIQAMVIQALKDDINRLCEDWEIDKHRTLNGWAFTINIENK